MSPRRAALLASPVLVPLVLYLCIYSRYSISAPEILSSPARDLAIKHLRAALEDRPMKLPATGLDATPAGPVWVTVLLDGNNLFRTRQDTGTLHHRLTAAMEAIGKDNDLRQLNDGERRRARIKVDLSLARGPIFASVPFFFAKSVVPGLDGIGLEVAGKTAYLLPDDLFRRQLLAGYQPFWFMHEFRTGLDLKTVVNALADQTDLTMEQWRAASPRYFRFRLQSFVEHRGRSVPIKRFRVPVPTVNRAQVQQAVRRAVDYVLRQMKPDGKFHYIYYPLVNNHSPAGEYSIPRHAGTTWFLALGYRKLKDKKVLTAVRLAIDYLGKNAVPAACKDTPYACVGEGDKVGLGSAALTLVAITEYQVATGDRRFEPLARRLGEFILWMQKPNGDFCHQYSPASKQKHCDDIMLYYSGEASLALAKLYQITKDKKYVKPLERAMDFLTGEKYEYFLGKFFISEDHWTCIAAEAAFDAVNKAQYADFCYEFAKLNRRSQVQAGDGLNGDLTGAFNITPFFIPHNTPAGSRTEANVATYRLSVLRGDPQPEVLDTVRQSIRYLVDQQISPGSAYLYPRPNLALGGMIKTPMRASIRIDYVQHAAAAMARGLTLIPE